MFRANDKVFDMTEGANHTVIHVITKIYYDDGCNIDVVGLDYEYIVSVECLEYANKE